MSNLNPHDAPFSMADMPRHPESGRGALVFHLVGTFALLWGIVAWLEWFLIPIVNPATGGPVPHLAFAPQAILLFLGCVAIILIMPVWEFGTRCWWMLVYAVPAAAYVVFQVCRVI